MKIFISMPMRGRTKENIDKSMEKMKAHLRIALGNDVEFINTKVEEKPPYNTESEALWYLGKSIQLLSQADAFACIEDLYNYVNDAPGCHLERQAFRRYHKDNLIFEVPARWVFEPEELRAIGDAEPGVGLCEKEGSACKSI